MEKIGVADYGIYAWSGGFYDYGERIARVGAIGFDGLERLYPTSAEDALQKASNLKKMKMGFATCNAENPELAIRWTAALGGKYVWAEVAGGDFDSYVRRVREMTRVANRYGIDVAVHNHLGQTVESQEEIEAFLRDAPLLPEYLVASPDLWNRRQDSGLSGVAVMLGAAKLPPLCRADDRRVAGWRQLREYLHGKDGVPFLYVDSQCSELISCMQGLLCDPHRPEDAASHPHALTHAPEALRYAVMSRLGCGGGADHARGACADFRFSVQGAWD
jgi:hypothetical protein